MFSYLIKKQRRRAEERKRQEEMLKGKFLFKFLIQTRHL